MATHGHVDFIWSIAKRLRGAFKQHEYGAQGELVCGGDVSSRSAIASAIHV